MLPEFFEFHNPTKVVYGVGLALDLQAELSQLPATRYFLVSDRVIQSIGLLDDIKVGLEAACVAVAGGMDPTAPETFAELRDMPRSGWESSPDDPLEKTYCPMEHVWSLYGDRGRELGYLYCQIDRVLYQGFGMDLERPLCRAKGDAVCRFILTPSESASPRS